MLDCKRKGIGDKKLKILKLKKILNTLRNETLSYSNELLEE